MSKAYDIVIVGAGPAGLLAALAAGRAGLSVALLERKKDPCRIERLCGQTIVSANDYYFDDLAMVSPGAGRISFPHNGLSFAYSGPVKSLHGWHIYSPDGGGWHSVILLKPAARAKQAWWAMPMTKRCCFGVCLTRFARQAWKFMQVRALTGSSCCRHRSGLRRRLSL